MIEILLVDDESYVTESIEATIPWNDLGVEKVYRADSAEAALAVLREQSIDIVVTDIRMPEIDGLELIERIEREWPHIRCMVLTGYSDFEYAKKALQLQAFDYILKYGRRRGVYPQPYERDRSFEGRMGGRRKIP